MTEDQLNQFQTIEDEIDFIELIAIPFRHWKVVITFFTLGSLLSGLYTFTPKETIRIIVDPGQIMLPSGNISASDIVPAVTHDYIILGLFSESNLKQLIAKINADNYAYVYDKNGPRYTFNAGDQQIATLRFKSPEANTKIKNLEIELTLNIRGDWLKDWVDKALQKVISEGNSNYENYKAYKNSVFEAVTEFSGKSLTDKQIDLQDKNYQLQVFSARPASVLNVDAGFNFVERKKLIVGLILSFFLANLLSFFYDFVSRPDVRLRFLAAVRQKH